MAATKQDPQQPPSNKRKLHAFIAAAMMLPRLNVKLPKPPKSRKLHALTAAALALPGLMPSAPVAAAGEDNTAVMQFGQFHESDRDLSGLQSKFAPIKSDSIFGSANFAITDSWKGVLNYRQDTWSGATPMATAPREWRGNRSRAPDGVSGATPYLVNTSGLYLDKNTLQPLATDGFGNLTGGVDTQLVHTISGASPEVRKQLDFNVSHEWQESAINFGAGTSIEPDYVSRFVNVGGRLDFNQKLTTLNLGLSYTSAEQKAIIDHDAAPYIFNACGTPSCNFVSSSSHIENEEGGKKIIKGDRHDWGGTVGLTQVINQNAQLNANLGYSRARGFLSNPYKVVEIGFIDPDQQFLAPSPDVLYITTNSLLEKRPDSRNQWQFDTRWAQYIAAADAGLHLRYGFFHDDWGINAHTFEGEWAQPFGNGWTITPQLRYYSQSAADFYVPYLVTDQAQQRIITDPATGRLRQVPFDLSKLPEFYSSDHRLSAYGALSGGILITKQFAKGVTFGLGYEYYKHAGSLKLGGGGEGSYADFHDYIVNASLKFDMEGMNMPAMNMPGMSGPGHEGHTMPAGADHMHHMHAGMLAPAGVMWGHVLNAGDFMIGYRFMSMRQHGDMLHGSDKVSDADVQANGCEGPCLTSPVTMNMYMHMLDLMYAPTNWLTLMVMPSYMDMSMSMKGLLTEAEQLQLPFTTNALYEHHTMHDHTTGGIGDTGLYASFKLFESPVHTLHATLGFTAPTGDVDIKLRPTHQVDPGFQHYHMQLGSGTWDANPSITYNGLADKWFWGAQLSGTARLENRNKSGYRLGDIFQATAWGGYKLTEGLSASLRGVYTDQGTIKGEFNDTFYKLGPVDYPSNYGGRLYDLGVGLQYAVQSGAWAGNQFAVEWMQPLKDDFNGYQLERRGALNATWMYMF